MQKKLPRLTLLVLLLLWMSCSPPQKENNQTDILEAYVPNSAKDTSLLKKKTSISLPNPSKSHTKYCEVVGWGKGNKPMAPFGFTVEKYADDLVSPRWLYQLPNGDVLVAEANTEVKGIKKLGAEVLGIAKSQRLGKSANRITLFRDADKDGKPEFRSIFLEQLNQPLGMLLLHDTFYVANTDGIVCFPYQTGQTHISIPPKKIINLPAGGYNNHWTRNLISNGTKLYVSVGSGTNLADHGMENEKDRASIWELNPNGSSKRIFASGLRNPVGMDWHPESKTLWTAVNERDRLGDSLVSDYLTSVKEGGFYGWPWSYFGPHVDLRVSPRNSEMVKKALIPDVALGPHTASLGLAFYNQDRFPPNYRKGAFIGQRGSWNNSQLVGYKVVFVPFENGKPVGQPEDFLTGFIADLQKGEVYGRPVGVKVLSDGSLLVADDAGNAIWRVSYSK